jgi:hypothetical protein
MRPADQPTLTGLVLCQKGRRPLQLMGRAERIRKARKSEKMSVWETEDNWYIQLPRGARGNNIKIDPT